MAAALAAVAGFTDAHLFLHVADVFVANMSGNIVLLGMAAGKLDGTGVAGPMVAIVAFVTGMAIATWFHDRRRRGGRSLRPDLLVVLEMVLFVGLIVLTIGHTTALAGTATPRAYPILAVGGLAMGVQTAVLRRVGDVPVATTYESGLVARLGEESVLASSDARTTRERTARARIVGVLSVLVATYAGGAALGAALGSSTAWLAVPVVVLAGVAIALHRRRRSRPDDGERR
jgi:uncharacterized membrane protein YoaK (UPF0700 family)